MDHKGEICMARTPSDLLALVILTVLSISLYGDVDYAQESSWHFAK